MDFEQRQNVPLDEYMLMIRYKTAVLLAAALKIGALYASAPDTDIENLYQFGIHLGLAFQLQDDLLDAFGNTDTFGKQTGQDIRDNKKTYLILTALQSAPQPLRDELTALFSSTPADTNPKVQRVLQIYSDLGIRSQVEQAIDQQFLQAASCLDQIQVPDQNKTPLRDLAGTLSGRKK
jgi:geranylgeranyl diphosphate synthase type II